MNILVPAAGGGTRFAAAGFSFPKLLIDVSGKPMIERVVENISFPGAKYFFLVQREHNDKYNLSQMLDTIAPGCVVIDVDGLTEGAACTALLARDHMKHDESLLIANSDQLIDYSRENFEIVSRHTTASCIVFTFHAAHPKWSFVRLDEHGCIIEVVEKRAVSNIATSGVYWFHMTGDFIRAADEMIAANDRTKNEYYLAPSINYIIRKGNKVLPFFVDKMYGLGTPEDLEHYLRICNR